MLHLFECMFSMTLLSGGVRVGAHRGRRGGRGRASRSFPLQLNSNSVLGLVLKIWYRIPFDQSEMSVSRISGSPVTPTLSLNCFDRATSRSHPLKVLTSS
jgi:hypothetical protein